MKLSAYLQVLRNSPKLEFTIKNFRRFYPDSYFYLVSDGGDDLSLIAKKFNCDYLYSSINCGISSDGHTRHQAVEWFTRFHTACLKCKSDYLIYLEDDVLIRGEINVNPNWKLACVLENVMNPAFERFSIRRFGTRFNTNLFGACGGAIYHVPTVLALSNFIFDRINLDFFEFQSYVGGKFGFADMYMTIFFMMGGAEVSLNTEMTESHRNPNWLNSYHPIVHGKSIYSDPRAI